MALSQELESLLYPDSAPLETGFLKVSDLHTVYWETHGKPDGIPVVCLHGGPGSGMSGWHTRIFPPDQYFIVRFDQRGCGQSTPFAALQENTTQHLIADMEQLRAHLNIESWNIFGGSWGSTLALAYADAHPERIRHMLLYGIFLCQKNELALTFTRNGAAANLYPEYFERFLSILPPDQRVDPVNGYAALFRSDDPKIQEEAVRGWCHWETRIMDIAVDESLFDPALEDMTHLKAVALLEHHYFQHQGFIDGHNLLKNLHKKMIGKKVSIIQGRYDLVCPPVTAHALHDALPQSTLTMIPRAGHTAKHPDTMQAILSAVKTLV